MLVLQFPLSHPPSSSLASVAGVWLVEGMMGRFMIVLSLMVVVLLRCSAALAVAALGAPVLAPRELAPRKVLKDLQTGWCRSNFLASEYTILSLSLSLSLVPG